MNKSEVVIGKVYAVKVSGNVVPVRLDSESQYGGWSGTNLKTKREIRIRSAAKLRREWINPVHLGDVVLNGQSAQPLAQQLNEQIKPIAEKAWEMHPNNPKNKAV